MEENTAGSDIEDGNQSGAISRQVSGQSAGVTDEGSEIRGLSSSDLLDNLASKVGARQSFTQSAGLRKDLRNVTEWGAVFSTRGRESVQLQAAQIGSICKLIVALHSEVSSISDTFKESVNELVVASNAASEHRQALENAARLDREMAKVESDIVRRLRSDTQDKFKAIAGDIKRSSNVLLESVRASEKSGRELLQQNFTEQLNTLSTAGEANRMFIDKLSAHVEELDTRLTGNFNRLRDEHHRVDNLADHTMRTLGTLDDVQRRLDWAEGTEQSMKTFALTVGGLKEELHHLKGLALDYDDSEPDVENHAGVPFPFNEQAIPIISEQQRDDFALHRASSEDDAVATVVDGRKGRKKSIAIFNRSSSSAENSPPSPKSPSALSVSGIQDSPSPRNPQASSPRLRSPQTSSPRLRKQATMASPATMSTSAGEPQVSGSALSKLEQRLDQLETGERELQKAHENLERRVSANQFLKGALDTIKKDLSQLRDASGEFQEYVTDQFKDFRQTELEHAIKSFRSRCSVALQMPLISPFEMFRCWMKFVQDRHRFRESMEKVKTVYSKRHVGARVQSWNYMSQKNLQQATLDRSEHRQESVESQLENLASTVRKRERASVEQAKDVHSRIGTVEKRLENHASKKADHVTMVEMVGAIEERIENDIRPAKMKQDIADLWEAVKVLESSKTDVKMTERNGKRVNELTMEVREAVKEHTVAIQKCAKLEDIATKANASIVEQVVLMLAQQADQLAHCVASDLDMFKLTLGRFLELSPDVRKAALSLGLQENEQCVTCRKMDRKLVNAEPLMGRDGILYRMSPESFDAMNEETQRVVNEKMKFPSQLMSSLVAGTATSPFGESWAPVRPQASPAVMSQAPGKVSTKVFNSEGVDTREHQDLLSGIRKLVTKDPGWVAGPDLRTLAGSDVRRKGKAVRKGLSPSPERTITRPASVSSSTTRPPSSRSYFPASERASNDQRPRTLFKELPRETSMALKGDSQVPSMPQVTSDA
jgi:hypothetical protein